MARGWTPATELAVPTSRGTSKDGVVCVAVAGALPTNAQRQVTVNLVYNASLLRK